MPSDDEDGQKTNPYMTPRQREKLFQDHERGLGEKPGDFLEKMRDDKVEGLGERFDNLYRDIKALSEAGFFSGDRSADYWDRVETDKERWEEWEWAPHLKQVLNNRNGIFGQNYDGQTSTPRKFGVKLGRCVRLLCGGRVPDEVMLRIAFDFLEGLMFDPKQDRYTSDLHVQSRMLEYTRRLESQASAWQFVEMSEIESSADLHERWDLQEEVVEKHGLNATKAILYLLVEEVDFFPTDPTDPDAEPPDGNLADVDQYLSELKTDTDIERADELLDRVRSSINHLREITTYVDLADLFKQVYVATEEEGGRFNTASLPPSDHDKCVHHLKQFAGKKENSYMWAESPIVEVAGEDWVLTDFGRLVGYELFGKEEDYLGWIHHYAFEGELELEADEYQLVDDALAELEI
jgi:hypothetical protein